MWGAHTRNDDAPKPGFEPRFKPSAFFIQPSHYPVSGTDKHSDLCSGPRVISWHPNS